MLQQRRAHPTALHSVGDGQREFGHARLRGTFVRPDANELTGEPYAQYGVVTIRLQGRGLSDAFQGLTAGPARQGSDVTRPQDLWPGSGIRQAEVPREPLSALR